MSHEYIYCYLDYIINFCILDSMIKVSLMDYMYIWRDLFVIIVLVLIFYIFIIDVIVCRYLNYLMTSMLVYRIKVWSIFLIILILMFLIKTFFGLQTTGFNFLLELKNKDLDRKNLILSFNCGNRYYLNSKILLRLLGRIDLIIGRV